MKKISALFVALFLVVGSSLLVQPKKAVSNENVTCGDNQYPVPKVIPDPRRSVEVFCVDNIDITGTP